MYDAVAVGMAQVCKTEVGGSNPPGIVVDKNQLKKCSKESALSCNK